jgi:Legionella pneumophila major outer membrane protein precursor
MNKNLLFSMLALTACAFADGDTNSSTLLADDNLVAGGCDTPCKPKPVECKPKPVECKPKPKPCEPCIRRGVAPIVLTSSRPCDDLGLYLFADALYWHADVTNAEWAFVNSAAAVTAPAAGKNQELAFKWNWGFRAGIGFEFDHDQWDTNLYYTWFRNKTASNSSTSSASFNVPVGGSASSLNTDSGMTTTAVLTGSASAKLNFNVLDWELGRSFYISNSISLRPHIGVKGAWNKLTENESFTASTAGLASYSSRDRTKSWAIGPSTGINSNWYFGCANTMSSGRNGEVKDRPGFSIFGDVSGALMYGHFKNSHSESGATSGGVAFGGLNVSGLNRNLMVPVLTGMMGLAWDMCFDCDKMHLGIRAGYELQYWFRQNQRFAFNSLGATPRYTRTTGDLALQGLTIDVRFDF